MPTYAYRCTACAHQFDQFQRFSDDPLTECPECGQLIRRVIQPVGIVFKGSGWYITDSRKPAPAESNGAAAKDGDSKDKDKTKDKDKEKSGTKEKKAEPATTAAGSGKTAAAD